MADYTIVEEALKRGYTMDEIADNLARDNGVDPADARGRGYTTGEMMKNLGYVKPETSDVARGFVTSFKQLPQLGYGLLAGAGAVAESVAGEGGVSTSMKNFGVKKYQEAGADIEKDSKQSDSLSYSWEQAKQGDFGSLVDWLQYGIGYGGGQAVQALATAGVGSLVGKTVLKGTAENLASKMVAKEALRLGATEEAKRLTAQEISKIAVANVASNIGQTVAIGSQAFGMEGGEIFGDLAQKTVKEGRAATGGELAKAFGATAAAGALEFVGDKLGVDVMLGKSKMFKPASSMTGVGGRAARAAVAVPGTVLAEGGTEYLQTGIEEYGKGNEKNFLPFMQSESAQKQALDAAGLGAVGGGGMAMVGGAFSSPQKKDAAPSPSPSISSAQTADDAIAAFQDEVASVTPRGSFGNMDELAGFIEAERSDIGKRRGLLAQQQQDARDMENEFNGLVKDEQIDQSYRLNDAQRQRDAERARDGGYDLALQQREEQQGRTVEQLAAASEAQGFGNEEPTAMQLAMQRAQQKALDNEFSGLLKQERASLNEMRANVKRVAGVPVEQISTPQLEEIAQSEAHPNTKMAAVAALNDRHDAIQQERERLMQLREARLERQADQSVQGEQPGAVPDADNQANVKALTENAAKRQATQLTNQGYPTVAYPHPTQSGMWAIGLAEEAKTANLTQNDAPSRPSASWDEQPAIEVKQPIPRKKPSPDNIAQAIINLGGISTSLKNDILGDAATRTRPGFFTSNGTTDLGALASRLSGEFGFSQINLNDATDNSGAKQLADLIARAVNGESILNEEAMIRAQEAEEVARHQDDINRKAEELGIKPSGRGRPFSKVEAEVLKLMEIRLNKEIEEAGINLEEARSIALRDISEEKLAEIQDKAMDALGENPSILETYRALAAGIKEAVNENERNKKADTEGSRSGIEVAGAGHAEEASRPATSGTAREGQSAEAEVAPEFGLVGQAEEEAIAEEQARRDAEAKRQREEQDAENKRQADADRGDLTPEDVAEAHPRGADAIGGEANSDAAAFDDSPAIVAEQERKVYDVNEPDAISGDLFPKELQHETLSKNQGKTDHRPRARTDRNLHAATALSVRQAPEIPGLYLATTQLVTVGERSLPVSRVHSNSDAARVFAYLSKYAVEHYDTLVTDKNGAPLAFIGSFKGDVTSTSVYPQTLLMELSRIDGAAHIWSAHNHPSGTPELSLSDERTSDLIGRILAGSGVEYHGLFAMASSDAENVSWSHTDGDSGSVRKGEPAAHRVAIVERQIEDSSRSGDVISNPATAFALVIGVAKETPGVVFTNAQNGIQAFVPFAADDMGMLRKDGRLIRLFNAAARAGAAGAVIAMPNGQVSLDQFANIRGALESIEVKVLDGIRYDTTTGKTESLAELRLSRTNGTAFFNAKSGSIGNPIDTSALESTIASVIAASPSQWGRDTVVTATLFSELPAPIVEKAKAEGYDAHGRNRDGQKLTGATYDGKVYLVQENISSEIEAEETLLHERIHQILHGNAEDENGKALRQSLGRLYSRIGGKDAIVALAKRIGADMSGPLAALPKVAVRNRPAFLVDEFLAHVEGQRAYEKFPQSVVRAIREFYGEFRDWLRSSKFVKIADAVGVNIGTFTQSDLSWTLKKIRQQQAGTGSKAIRFMTAWHGSPHDHDGFDSSKIGTGEGAQAYGWGLYFAGSREVAEWYRNNLASGYSLRGKRGYEHSTEEINAVFKIARLLSQGAKEQMAINLVAAEARRDVDQGKLLLAENEANLGKKVDGGAGWGHLRYHPVTQEDVNEARDGLERAQKRLAVIEGIRPGDVVKNKGRLYQVELAPEPDEYLDWDKPLSEQAKADLLRDVADQESMPVNYRRKALHEGRTGEDFYKALSAVLGSDEAASKVLNSYGIRGIRYLDGSSRSAGEGNHNYVIFNDADVKITAKESRRASNDTTPENAGVSVSGPSESVRRIQAVVERFKSQFKGASALDIRVVSTTFDIPARFRPSPFAEGVFHDDAGLVYLVTMNLRNPRGELSESRAWQVLLHESVGHYGLSQMMGDKFAGILKAVKQATLAGRKVSETQSNPLQPGDKDYTTWEAVQLRYPDATDAEIAQEVLARMAETDPGSSIVGYAVAVVRQWVRDVARAMGINLVVSTSELRDLVAKASGYMRRGDALAEERVPSGLVAASQKVGAGETAFKPVDTESAEFKRWFGDSKVVDAEGKPLVVYHGTSNDFTEFKNKYAGRVWEMFSDSSDYSNRFASNRGGRLVPVFLSIRRPLDLSSLPAIRGDVRNKLIPLLEDAGVKFDSNFKMADLPYERDLFQIINMAGHKSGFADAVIAAGYDGIIMPDNHDGDYLDDGRIIATTYIALSPTQIKSAISNTGAFDSTNPSILESRAAQGKPQGPIWNSPESSRADDVIYTMQDKNIDLKRVQQAIKEAASKSAGRLREKDVFGNGSKVQYFDDKRGLFYERQKYPSGRIGWRAGEVIDGMDYWLSDKEFGSMEEAHDAVRGLRISSAMKQKNAEKYGAIPALWSGEAKRVARAIIDAGIGVDRFSASTQSKSKYVYLESGVKVRIADHSLPARYDKADIDYRYGGDINALIAEIKEVEGAPSQSVDPDSIGSLSLGASRNEMQERPAMRADESGSPEEPAQSGGWAGSTDMLTGFGGNGKRGLESRARIIGDSGRQYTPEQQQMFKTVGRETNDLNTVERIKKWANKNWVQGIVDQFAPIKDIDLHAYTLTRLSKGAAGAFEAFMDHGKLSLKDGVYDADTGGGVMQNVFFPLGKETTDFLYWIAGNRAERLAKEGKERLFSPADIAASKALADGVTDFDYTLANGKTTRDRTLIYADSLKKFNEYNKNVMDMAEQSGLIDGASRHLWEHEFYVPFYRVMDESDGGVRGMNIKQGVVRQQAFKKLKGGEEGLNDLLANTLMNWAHLIDASAKNRAAKATLEAAQNLGIAQPAGYGEKKTVWYMGDVTRTIPKGQEYEDDGVTKVSNGTDKVQYHGRVEFSVSDPQLLIALQGLDYAGLRGPIMDILGKTKHMLTLGVTASPFFKIRNLIRDSVQAVGTSDLSYNIAKNLKQGADLTNHERQEYVSALAGGALIRFGTMLEGNEAARTRQLIKKGAKDEHILDNESKVRAFYDKYLEPGIAAYNELGNRGEEINRMALYDQLIKQGKSHAEASLMARDLMDFSLQGSFTTIRFLTQTVPFMNARLQGLYKLGRSAKDEPAKMAIVTGMVALASLALLAAYGDDDDWKKREDWDRNNYWWFKFAGVAFRIPKPFELGAIGTLSERSAELIFDNEMTGKRFKDVVLSVVSDQLSMNPVPQLVKPVIDIYANKDSFTGRPIESMSMEKLAPQYRYSAGTSMVARGASTAIGGALSPVQIDHLVRGYFSWLGAFAVGAADMAVRAASDEPTRPTMDYWKVATGGMVSDIDSSSSRYVSQMYEQAKELEQAYGTWRQLRKEGKIEDAAEYRADHAAELRKYHAIEGIKKAESKLNERIRMIERSNKEPAEKRDLIQQIQKQKDLIARRAF